MSERVWYYIESHKNDAFYNMALDELLMEKVRNRELPAVLRFYEWETPTLSLGYFQKVRKEIDLERVESYGYEMVRRATGGRGVLHDKELTYSVVLPESYEGMPESVTESYRVLSGGLLEGFRNLGLDAHFSVPQTKEERKELTSIRSSVCFDTPSWYELVVEGRKIAGSAQTRQNGIIMQHGSILLDVDIDHLFDMFKYQNQRFKEKMKKSFKEKAVAINDISENHFTVEMLYPAFKKGFEKGLDMKTAPYELTEEDTERLEEIKIKYVSDDWNFRK
ncbi:lipoate--protein ligase family protein [Salinicoccus halodurans]|uniref:Lipoate-protein ligase A n=1 Tax=Salinicoccus halodurans TaxID=407035 RepID=A0A0F7HLU2_9STAP|nr:biotin/lipoate A/B protein ligase family protein [Salinicoccus halodurans]AKG74023.1 octanoyltransferase [Salinicoccus halodurans]SFK59325.1 lipoate-protein ligase A [Salinicoccus halodurans]